MEEHRRLGLVGQLVGQGLREVGRVDVPVEDRQIRGERRIEHDRPVVVDGVVAAGTAHVAAGGTGAGADLHVVEEDVRDLARLGALVVVAPDADRVG